MGIPTVLRESNLQIDNAMLYSNIAAADLSSSFQDMARKTAKASEDRSKIDRHIDQSSETSILEIGPGTGELGRLLSTSNRLFLADITAEYLQECDFADGRFVCDVEHLPFNEEFDLVIACDVLEHVLNEADAVLSIKQALKEFGLLYVRCPANEPSVAYSRLLGGKFPYVHLRSYTKKSLRLILESCGFQIEEIGFLRRTPIGFARRDFLIPGLRRQRRLRNTAENASLHLRSSSFEMAQTDKFLTFLERSMYLISRLLTKSAANRFINVIWYRPSEIFAVARKTQDLEIIGSD
jgi:SAM-dependent methyltransferase